MAELFRLVKYDHLPRWLWFVMWDPRMKTTGSNWGRPWWVSEGFHLWKFRLDDTYPTKSEWRVDQLDPVGWLLVLWPFLLVRWLKLSVSWLGWGVCCGKEVWATQLLLVAVSPLAEDITISKTQMLGESPTIHPERAWLDTWLLVFTSWDSQC